MSAATTVGRLGLRILGPLEVVDGDSLLPVGAGKPLALLARLALDAGRVVHVEGLVDDLWGERPPDSAVKLIQISVSKLRRVVGSERIVTRGPGYLLDSAAEDVDANRFEQLLARGSSALRAGDACLAAGQLREALALWRGPALVDVAEPFAVAQARRLAELRLCALEERIDADLALGQEAGLVSELESLVAGNPLRERLRAQLMQALYCSGRQAEALAQYREVQRLLDAELGIQPTKRLRDLELRILQQDRDLEVAAAPAARRRSGVAIDASRPRGVAQHRVGCRWPDRRRPGGRGGARRLVRPAP